MTTDTITKLALAVATAAGLGGNAFQFTTAPVNNDSEWRETMERSVRMWREELHLERERCNVHPAHR